MDLPSPAAAGCRASPPYELLTLTLTRHTGPSHRLAEPITQTVVAIQTAGAEELGTVPRVLVARPGLSPVMVGRASELGRLRRLVQSSGEPRVALVSGEAGSGKTRLVQELLADLPTPARAMTARAEEGAMGRPFALLLEAVGPDVAEWDRVPEGLRAWEDALGTLLGPVAPGLHAQERPYASDELLRAAAELVRYLAAGSPAVIVFEDLHWADADSLGLFQRLSVTPNLDVLLLGHLPARGPGQAPPDRSARGGGAPHSRGARQHPPARSARRGVSDLCSEVHRGQLPDCCRAAQPHRRQPVLLGGAPRHSRRHPRTGSGRLSPAEDSHRGRPRSPRRARARRARGRRRRFDPRRADPFRPAHVCHGV